MGEAPLVRGGLTRRLCSHSQHLKKKVGFQTSGLYTQTEGLDSFSRS